MRKEKVKYPFRIFLLDNFDSFTFNLVDYFERLGCEVEVYRNTVDPAKVAEVDPDLIVFSPGPSVPANAGNMMKIIDLYHKKYPMFGVCLGHEAFIEYFGGTLKFVEPVHGKNSPIHHDGKTIFEGLDQNFLAGRYHSLCADKVPDCFEISATSGDLVMAIRHKGLPIEGVQFHPESVLTMKNGQGFKMIENLVREPGDVEKFLKNSVEGRLSVDEQVAFLENYMPEKVTAEDVRVFANFMLRNMTTRLNMADAIDICGTGGSGLQRINTSTIAAFILSGLGVGVAKHGNKAASGRFGSFDLLEELGVELEKSPEELEKLYKECGLAFIYARSFHPVMRFFAEARMAIEKPTIFNILGPLLSPAGVERQIIGTSFKGQMRLIAEACKLLGKKRVMVVRGCDGLDEVTLTGETEVVELNNGKISEYSINPGDFGVDSCEFEEIAGGDSEFNTDVALKILEGGCKSKHADLVFVNVALALKLAGVVDDLKEGYKLAKSVCGYEKLTGYKGGTRPHRSILHEIAEGKVLEKSDRDFLGALKENGVSVIAEIKKASPSEGDIFDGGMSISEIAKLYEEGGASAVSVVTDEKYFKGCFDNLRIVKRAVSLPLLCKDFIVNEYQIYKAREYGADAVLLIAGLLSDGQICNFIKLAKTLGMDVLVEVHNEAELKMVLKTNVEIIGINNRDLKDFSIDLETTNRLVKLCPPGKVIVSESGINSRGDIEKLDKRVDAVLIGTALMKAKNIKDKLNEITQKISTK